MTENIILKRDIQESSRRWNINQRDREYQFFINRSGDKTFTNSSKSTKSFFRTDPNYGPKSYNKSNKALPLSQHQNDSNSSPEQCAMCKRSFKRLRGLNQHKRVCKERQVIDSKVIETTSTTVFPITNFTVDEENIWNAE